MNFKYIILGIVFSFLWASASTASKIGLQSAQPFVISLTRFFIAGSIMLSIAHGLFKKRLPSGKEWKQLIIYGLLNITLYLGLYIISMKKISAGIGSLGVGVNPVMISFMAAAYHGKRIRYSTIVSLALCSAGVFLAAWPLLQNSYASADGLLILTCSMLAYSIGSIYYTNVRWSDLHILTINGWQTILGGLCMTPLLIFTYAGSKNNFDVSFWSGTLWLAIPVSIGAVQCWLLLLKHTPATASYWLFLTPVFGFLIANFWLNEPISWYTGAGILLVIAGLLITKRTREEAIEKEPALQE